MLIVQLTNLDFLDIYNFIVEQLKYFKFTSFKN